ncbi:MAG: uracil-DNA glycosylase family protein [Solirubrobacterales bacterium]
MTAALPDAAQRRERLVDLYHEASGCTLCPLAETRDQVVFGAGDANADVMFVGEAPGAEEDRRGLPFVGRAGGLLDRLLADVGLSRDAVFVANVLKCLRYRAPVQLGDGSWERIGRLVRSRYDGDVMSVDAAGQLVRRRVIGWHATPVGDRSVFRLRYRSAKRAGASKVGIELTGDHPVLTQRGFVRVDELLPSDRIATGQGMSAVARDVVLGTLLGDGSLNRSSAYLSFGHSERQEEYARFKAGLLSELFPRISHHQVAAAAGGAPLYGVVQVRTLAHRSLGVLRQEFYGDRKNVPIWMERELNERMLAFWFMDDGYTRIREGGRNPLAEIATNGFEDSDRQVLLRGLARLGLPAKASRSRLYFDVATTRRLCERIAPFVPPSMRYKLDPEVESQTAFDPGALAPGVPEVFFDDLDVEDITATPRSDTTFFCIDVEGTHNFVTAGGVVHNCRPPGNRDPESLEIETCRPYLERQVELVAPRVIATLGNFATKLLTGNPTGITRVRGTPQVHRLGGRPVFVLPVFHPAAALRNPQHVNVLREDFRQLADLSREQALDPEGEAPVAEPPEARSATHARGAAGPADDRAVPTAGPAGPAGNEPLPSDDQLDLF